MNVAVDINSMRAQWSDEPERLDALMDGETAALDAFINHMIDNRYDALREFVNDHIADLEDEAQRWNKPIQ